MAMVRRAMRPQKLALALLVVIIAPVASQTTILVSGGSRFSSPYYNFNPSSWDFVAGESYTFQANG